MSINSGNPFEDEYLETMSQMNSPDRGSIRRSGRKKRRAPQPPVSPAQMVRHFSPIFSSIIHMNLISFFSTLFALEDKA